MENHDDPHTRIETLRQAIGAADAEIAAGHGQEFASDAALLRAVSED